VARFPRTLFPASRRQLATSAVALTLAALALAGGGWYARAHYWVPRKQLEWAQRALNRRDFPEARRTLEQYLAAWPNDPRGHFLMARACRRSNELPQAEEHLIRCEHLQNDHPDPQLGDTKLEWALLEAQRGKIVETEPLLRRRMREKDPESVLILETMSWEMMRRNRLDEALALLNLWLEKEPQEYEALVRHGWVEDHLFHTEEALDDYRKALALEPERDSVRLRLVELLLDNNHFEEAVPEIETLRSHGENSAQVGLCHARCLRLRGQSQEAREVLDRVLAANPEFVAGLQLRAALATDAGRSDEALALLQKAAALEPLNYQVNYTLSQCLQRAGKVAEAKEVEARMARSKEQTARLRELINTVMQKPYDPSLRHEVGMIFLNNGLTREGLHWLNTALEADPTHRPTHEALARYYDTTGDKTLAEYHRAFVK
jgi:tetratricopeptide (TPR) repeat protein